MSEPNAPAVTVSTACELCEAAGGAVLFRNDKLRVVLVDDAAYPGFCRVIWQAHVREMTDLEPADRSLLMQTVCIVESVLRDTMQPLKVNLASLGNQTPHLHWHVIPRYLDDAHFPAPIWAAAQRATDGAVLETRIAKLEHFRLALQQRLAATERLA